MTTLYERCLAVYKESLYWQAKLRTYTVIAQTDADHAARMLPVGASCDAHRRVDEKYQYLCEVVAVNERLEKILENMRFSCANCNIDRTIEYFWEMMAVLFTI